MSSAAILCKLRLMLLVLLLLPFCAKASFPIPEQSFKVTPATAKEHGIEVEFQPAPWETHVQIVLRCLKKNKASRNFDSMKFRLMEKGDMTVSTSMVPTEKNGNITASFYVRRDRIVNCVVTLWYGQPYKDLVEYEIDLSTFRHNQGGAANRSQPFRSKTNSTSSAAGSGR